MNFKFTPFRFQIRLVLILNLYRLARKLDVSLILKSPVYAGLFYSRLFHGIGCVVFKPPCHYRKLATINSEINLSVYFKSPAYAGLIDLSVFLKQFLSTK